MNGAECRRQRTFSQSKYLSLCIREKPDKGEKGRGEEESEEKTVGERGERPVFVGFSNFPPFPEGFLLSPVRKQIILNRSKQQLSI